MDTITSSVLSSIIYNLLKTGATLTVGKLNNVLSGYITSDKNVAIIAEKISQMNIDKGMSEAAIEEELCIDKELLNLLKEESSSASVNINQIHNGTGDNIGGNKYGR